jgi:hypothetical protein
LRRRRARGTAAVHARPDDADAALALIFLRQKHTTILHSSSPIVRDEFVQGSTGDTWPAQSLFFPDTCSFQGDLSPDRSPATDQVSYAYMFSNRSPAGRIDVRDHPFKRSPRPVISPAIQTLDRLP